MKSEVKRQNFNTTPEQEAELVRLRDLLDAPSIKDAILRAARVVALLAQEADRGSVLYIKEAGGEMMRLLIPEFESPRAEVWTYLVERPHTWRRQLYVKGRKLLASTVWSDMRANSMTIEEAADNWSLPVGAIQEIGRYCKDNEALLRMEAEEEQKRLFSDSVEAVKGRSGHEPVPAAG